MLEGKQRAWVWERLGRLWRAMNALAARIRAGAASPRVVPRCRMGEMGARRRASCAPEPCANEEAPRAPGEMGCG